MLPAGRASVVWLVGEFGSSPPGVSQSLAIFQKHTDNGDDDDEGAEANCDHIKNVAPDVLRVLAQSFVDEATEVRVAVVCVVRWALCTRMYF